MGENPGTTLEAEKPKEGNVESAKKLDLNAPAKWEWKDFKLFLALLIGMAYSIVRGLESYYRFDVWETTPAYRKAAMVTGAISVVVMPFVGALVVYLYFHLRGKEKRE